jgi:hypothetical protein
MDESTMVETEKQEGKTITVTHMRVSRDGKSMEVESLDKLRGGTMSYTAEKRP